MSVQLKTPTPAVSAPGSRTLGESALGTAVARSSSIGAPPPASASAGLRALVAPYAVPESVTVVSVSGLEPSDSSKQYALRRSRPNARFPATR